MLFQHSTCCNGLFYLSGSFKLIYKNQPQSGEVSRSLHTRNLSWQQDLSVQKKRSTDIHEDIGNKKEYNKIINRQYN